MVATKEKALDNFYAESVEPERSPYGVRENQPLAGPRTEYGADIGSKVQKLEKGMWVKAWDTRTGEMSMVNRVHLPYLDGSNAKAWRHPDGTLCYSLSSVNVKPERGTLTCLLHPKHPMRQHYVEIGIGRSRDCRKQGIPSELDVRRHMEKRHRDAWAVIKEDRERQEKLEEREFQRGIMKALLQAQGIEAPVDSVLGGVGTGTGPQAAATGRPPGEVSKVKSPATVACGVGNCAATFSAVNRGAAVARRGAHVRKEHANDSGTQSA